MASDLNGAGEAGEAIFLYCLAGVEYGRAVDLVGENDSLAVDVEAAIFTARWGIIAVHPAGFGPGGKANVAADDGAAGMEVGAEGDALKLEQDRPVFGCRWGEETTARPADPACAPAEVVGVKARGGAIVQSHRNAFHDGREIWPAGFKGIGDDWAEFGFFLGTSWRDKARQEKNHSTGM